LPPGLFNVVGERQMRKSLRRIAKQISISIASLFTGTMVANADVRIDRSKSAEIVSRTHVEGQSLSFCSPGEARLPIPDTCCLSPPDFAMLDPTRAINNPGGAQDLRLNEDRRSRFDQSKSNPCYQRHYWFCQADAWISA
jgi:hypothetical protein